MVEIGGRDADLAGHRALVEAELAAEPPEPPAEIELSVRCHVVTLS
jgi:hypothetical protein